MTDAIQMSGADLDVSDEQAVLQVLRSGVLSMGAATAEFEQRCAEIAARSHGIAVSSGTAGLHILIRALGIGRGDEVMVPSFTFAASANAFINEGATPAFVDIEPDTYNLAPSELARKRTGRTAAVMAVDIFGHPADWSTINEVAPDLLLIDDACEAIGARLGDAPAGSFGRAGVFGFYPNKQMTTGEGGMIVTDDPALAEGCRSLRNQGRGAMGGWLEHKRLGFNYRMDEMSAALGVSQISRLDLLLARRAEVAATYTKSLAGLGSVRPPVVRPGVHMSWFVYAVTLAEGIDRDAVMDHLSLKGIPTRAYFTPLHLQPYIRTRYGDMKGELPVTESVAARVLALPFHANLRGEDAERVVEALTEALRLQG